MRTLPPSSFRTFLKITLYRPYSQVEVPVVWMTRRSQHIRPVLQQLHWLPISYRIEYKVATLVHKISLTARPSYLNILLTEYTPTRQLHSSNTRLLQQLRSSTDITWRAFSRAAPTVWNNLPTNIRFADSFMNFHSLLRTHFYRLGFN